jgi:hypothetical protein
VLKLRSNLYRPFLPALLSRVWGGNVWGLCRKESGGPPAGDLRKRLMCVDCGSSRLSPTDAGGLRCLGCGRAYAAVDGVVRMLPKALEAQLELS